MRRCFTLAIVAFFVAVSGGSFVGAFSRLGLRSGTIRAVQNPPKRPMPRSATRRVQTVFDYVEATAKGALTDQPPDVNRYIQEVFRHTVFGNAPTAIRERVVRAEIAFRRGGATGVSAESLVYTINRAADEIGAPGYFATSTQQVNLYRSIMRQFIPDLGRSATRRTTLAQPMSPAEVMFIALNLVTQKLMNPEYQKPLSSWLTRTNTWLETPDAVPPIKLILDPWCQRARRTILIDLPKDQRDYTDSAMLLLDRLDLEK